MSTQRFFPSSESDQVAWLTNFASKLAKHGPTLGIIAAEITTTQADCVYLAWWLQTCSPAVQNSSKEVIANKRLLASGTGTTAVAVPVLPVFAGAPAPVLPGVLTRLFNLIQRAKLSPKFTEAIGQDLGVVGTADTTEHPTSEFSAALEQGPRGPRARLDFTKYGHQGVIVECRTNGGDWIGLGPATVKPTYDERPVTTAGTPEAREYRMRWWDKDEANGDWSAVQTVLVGG